MTDEQMIEAKPKSTREIAEQTLLGDMMNCVLDQVKALPKAWQQMSQSEQDAFLGDIEAGCRNATTQVARILMAQERINVPAIVESVTFKDGIKAVLKVTGNAPGRHELADSEGQFVSILISNVDELLNDEGKPKSEPDQRGLDLGHEYDEDQDGQGAFSGEDGQDELFQAAVNAVRNEGKASISFLQRSLRIGYNRAARIVEALEEAGIVSKADADGKREVLAPPADALELSKEEEARLA